MQGLGIKFYLEEDPGIPGSIAIYTYLDENSPDKYYLQPTVGDNLITAKMGPPEYIFGIVSSQPLPSIQ